MLTDRKDCCQVSAIIGSKNNVEGLLEALHLKGLKQHDISILMSERTRNLLLSLREETKAPEGAGIGFVTGGLLGALIGGLTTVGSFLVPELGLVASGPLVEILMVGAIGGAAGGAIGTLVGAGIPEQEAEYVEDALKEEGNVLVVAHVPNNKLGEARSVFEQFGARRIQVYH